MYVGILFQFEKFTNNKIWQILIFMASLPQGDLIYEIIGDYPGPDFFAIDESSGKLTLIQDLKADSLRSDKYLVSVF